MEGGTCFVGCVDMMMFVTVFERLPSEALRV